MSSIPVILGRPLSIHRQLSTSESSPTNSSLLQSHEPQLTTNVMPSYTTQSKTLSAPGPERNDPNHNQAANRSSNSQSGDSELTALSHGLSENDTRERPDQQLGQSTEKTGEQAALTGMTMAGTGEASERLLAHGTNDMSPRRWEDMEMERKHNFWSNTIKERRRKTLLSTLRVFGLITVWLWLCMPIFWGSTYQLEAYFSNLNVHVVSFDTASASLLAPAMISEANSQAALPQSIPHLGWEVKSTSDYLNGLTDVAADVVGQSSWGVVVINENATSAYLAALENGDGTYDPNGAIGIYMASARFYQVTLLYVEPLIIASVSTALTNARAAAYQAFVTANANNATVLANAARVPQALGVGFGYTMHDLRSIGNNQWSAAAPMEAALIYFVIFAFYIALFSAAGRMKSGLVTKLRFSSMLLMRLGWPLLAYFFMSLWQTLVVLAWQIPLENYLGRAGFVVLWALNYATLIAGGLAMETILALVGLAWLPFFLIFWIIVNITSSFFPIDIMPTFYHFVRWLPFYHNIEAYKIIAFGTNWNHRLGLHFGVLFALIGVELICLPLAVMFERWRLDRGQMREIQEKKRKEMEGEKQGREV